MINRLNLAFFTLMLLILMGGQSRAANKLFDQLTQRGLEVAPQEVVKLPMPVFADGTTAAAQQQSVESLVAGRYDWETFTRNSVVSPFVLKISGGENDANRIGRQVDLYFIAYGPLSKLKSENYLQEQLGFASSESQGDESGSVKVLKGDELKKRSLAEATDDERWVAVESTFLGKVRINLTTNNLRTSTADSVLMASMADPRFNRDQEFPNMWRLVNVDDAGNHQLGLPQPYSSLGSYAKATQLAAPAGALFIEYHVAFAEPHDWFHGANLLRSKLPIVAQDMVRKFRRSLSAK